MKAWKRIHITKKRAACGVLGLLLLAAAYMGVPRAAEKVFAGCDAARLCEPLSVVDFETGEARILGVACEIKIKL